MGGPHPAVLRCALGLAGLVLVAACGSTPSTAPPTVAGVATSPASTQAPAVTAPPAPTTATTPAPTLAEGEPCALQPAESMDQTCPMPAGDYQSTRFAPGVSFILEGDGWRNAANEPDAIAAIRPPDSWLTFVSGAPIGATGDLDSPEAAKAAFKAMTGVMVEARDDVELGGIPAVVFDVSNEGEAELTLFSYPTTPGVYFLVPGSALRIWWLTIDGSPTLLILEAPSPELDALVDDMQPTIDSIAWG